MDRIFKWKGVIKAISPKIIRPRPSDAKPKAKPKARRKGIRARRAKPSAGDVSASVASETELVEAKEEEWEVDVEKLKPEQPLLWPRKVAVAGHTFAKIRIKDLWKQKPLPKIPAQYRHDKLEDAPAHAEQDFESQSLLLREPVVDATSSELERLQIQTIVGLVDDLEVEVGGVRLSRKLLFLSNKQAKLLPMDNMNKIMSSLDFYPRPKLVIQLVFSTAGGQGQYCATRLLEHHWDDCKLKSHDVNLEHYFVSEQGLTGVKEAEYKLHTFLKECLLPLARQHHALVIVSHSNCSLSRIFGKLCAAEAERRRGNLGFYLLAFIAAPTVLMSSAKPGTVAYQLRKACKTWQKMDQKMRDVLRKERGPESILYNHYLDAPDGCTHYIVVDCISEGEDGKLKRDWGPAGLVRSRLVQAMLSNQVPGFGVATLQRAWGLVGLKNLSDQVARGIPLLLLDSRTPAEGSIQSADHAIEHLRSIEEELSRANTGNFYYTSTLAFLHQVLTRMLHQPIRRQLSMEDLHIAGSEAMEETTDERPVPLWEKISRLDEGAFGKANPTETGIRLRKQDRRRHLAEEITEKFLQFVGQGMAFTQEWGEFREISVVPKQHIADIFLRTVGELLRCNSQVELNVFLEHYSLTELSTKQIEEIVKSKPSLFCVKHGMKNSALFKSILQVPTENWQDAKQYMFDHLKEESFQFDGKFQPRHLSESPDIKASIVEVLASPLTYSANLIDLAEIEKVLLLVNVDRQMQTSGLTSCRVLQRAWADVDVYHHVAGRMKFIAKVCYALVLLTGYAITVLTLVNLNVPDALPETLTNHLVLGLSVSAGLTSAVIAFVDPTTKWQQLRAAALTLEGEIWKFRSCAGAYARDMLSSYAESAEDSLGYFVSTVEDSVLKSAGISETSFLSTFSFSGAPASLQIYKHGQYRGAAWKGELQETQEPGSEVDDHYSALTARQYMALRFEPHVKFYQQRLPKYARWHTLHQAFLAIASGLLTVLVFLGEAKWCAICTGGVAAATAWIEFTSAQKKMRRYSETVHQAHQILLWWQSLQRMQQAANFTVLVQRCESCFASEHLSWVSSMNADNQERGQRAKTSEERGEQRLQTGTE